MISGWIWTLLNLYLVISLCAIFYDLSVMLTAGARARRQERRRAELRALLEGQLSRLEAGGSLDGQVQRELLGRLRHVEGVLAFSDLAEGWAGSPGFSALLAASGPLFTRLCRVYARQSAMHRASFSWALAACGGGVPGTRNFLLKCAVDRGNIYCRENALTALYRGGDPAPVVTALKRMSRLEVQHSQKLLTDGLLSFRGDREELCKRLWAEYSALSPGVRLALIDFIRLLGADYREPLLALLDDPDSDDELCFAILRYFGRFHSDAARDRMTGFLSAPRRGLWEYAAVSASSLRGYSGEAAIRALTAALSDANWYVRFNSAESLVAMDLPEAVYQAVLEGGDRFARDILGYMLERRRLAKAQRTAAARERKGGGALVPS